MMGGLTAFSLLLILSFQSTPSLAFHISESAITSPDASEDQTVYFQIEVNEFFKRPVPAPIKQAISIFQEKDKKLNYDLATMITAAPGSPGFPRPLWLVLLASLPTGLLWYGYYKFAVEEELLQIEIEKGKEPRGFGGYGTLGPFTYGMLLGPVAEILNLPGGMHWSLLAALYLYFSQFLLYDRVNDLYQDEGLEKPLQAWWCLPLFFPFNIIVGLRQVHFLSQFFACQRGEEPTADPISDFFPFIKVESLTWQKFLLTPKLWCSLFSDVESIDPKMLPKQWQPILESGLS